ncbi:MAG TPA: IS110 family transposase [Mycobacteriales bacterium]|nr:IS110 family transposase [Mycobacteriales bacterium]
MHAKLLAAPRGVTGDQAVSRAQITLTYVATLTTLKQQIAVLDAQIREQLPAHPDSEIFTSLPRSGTVRAARLLSEIGDCRARFPTPESLACLAGVAPSTQASGKSRHVGFRWACDKQLRDAVTDFAGDTRRANPWAAQLYKHAIDRGHDHAHATRILARAWLFVIWHCWQNHTAYDPAQHNALQRVLNEQTKIKTAAA